MLISILGFYFFINGLFVELLLVLWRKGSCLFIKFSQVEFILHIIQLLILDIAGSFS